MTKFILPIVLALGLTACASNGDIDDDQRRTQVYAFIQSEIDLAIGIYGEDFLDDLNRNERFAILSLCNAAVIFSTGSDFPADAPTQVFETCTALRGSMGAAEGVGP